MLHLSHTVRYLKIMQNHIIAKLNYVKLHIVGKTCQITYEKKIRQITEVKIPSKIK